MTTDLVKHEEPELHITPSMESKTPTEILEDAREKAKALQTIIRGKAKPVIFNNEQYLEFEDWQTAGAFYGISVKVVSTNFVEYGDAKGFEARAVAIDKRNGAEISAAEAICLNDEKNWSMKPLFQLKSMAQTRACAKALRNVLAWMVVLAGFKPTPAEEMQEIVQESPKTSPIKTIQVEGKHQSKGNGEIPDDQLGNWVMPWGKKYKGMRLVQIMGQVTDTGKAVGKEWLEWAAENGENEKEKAIIKRFLNLMIQ